MLRLTIIFFLIITNVTAQKLTKNTDMGFSEKVKKAFKTQGDFENEYHFDKKGRLIKHVTNYGGLDIYIMYECLCSTTEYYYDSDNLAEVRHLFDGKLGSIDKYKYNGENVILHERIEDTVVTFSKKYHYENDRLMQITEVQNYDAIKTYITKFSYRDTLGFTEMTEYDYDSFKRNKTIFTKVGYKLVDYGGWKEEEYYDSNNNIIRKTYREGNGKVYGNDIYKYSGRQLISSKHYSQNKLRFEIFYDRMGNMALEKRYDRNENIKYNYKYRFNKHGDLTFIKWFEYGHIHKKRIKYEYWD